jgi:hypothetical protein
MSLLSPLQLAWLGLTVPLVVLYVLKRRREEREVSSTLLWELALRDMRAERPWKRLIPQVSLFLQLLVIVAGAIALARPVGAGGIASGARMAVIVDTSASMAAGDGDTTRLERAKSVAKSLARALPPGGDMMLIEASSEPAVLAAPTRDATSLATILDRVEVRGASADLEAAVALAAERLRGAPPGSKIVLLTDGALDGEIALDGRTAPVEVRQVGGAVANDAIVALDVRARPSEDHPDRADVFARVRRFGERDADLFVTASVGDAVVASRRITVASNTTESVVMPVDLPPDAHGRSPVVRLQIARADEGAPVDPFPLDDVAVAPSPGARRLPVFLVGGPSVALERLLRADRDVELFATTLGALEGRDEDAPTLDGLFIYVGETPGAPPLGDSVVVAPTGDTVFGVEIGERVTGPNIVTWDEDDARLRFVQLSDVHLAAVRPVATAAARTLVSTDRGAAISVVERPDGETTIVSFDPAESDWARSPSFVVFFRNLLERARTRRAAGGVAAGRIGDALRVPLAAEGERVRVTTPSGAHADGQSRGGVAIVAVPPEPGVYRVEAGERELFALRNLLDPEESDLSPRARFTNAEREVVGAQAAAEQAESWPWFAGALLFFLFAEALWATRRGAT